MFLINIKVPEDGIPSRSSTAKLSFEQLFLETLTKISQRKNLC